METIHELVHAITNEGSTNNKRDLILQGDKIFGGLWRKILQATYHATDNYFIKKLPPTNGMVGMFTIESNYADVDNLLIDLKTRRITGKTAKMAVSDTMCMFTHESQEIIAKIITRDLGMGVGVGSINKMIPNLIETFDVVLAQKIENAKENEIIMDGEQWYLSRKLDGLRMIVKHRAGEIPQPFSRTGKPFLTLKKIMDELIEKYGDVDFVSDGEVCIIDEDGNEDFSAISSEYNKKNHVIENPMYVIFDMLTFDEFNSGTSERILEDRYKQLTTTMSDGKYHRVLEQVPLTPESLEDGKATAKRLGWEGLMLRKNVVYKSGRSKDLLKYKLFQDAEYVVDGIEVGDFSVSIQGKGQQILKDVVTAITFKHKGNKVSAGSGLSVAQRQTWSANPESIIGKTVTIKYFEESVNKKTGKLSLRFPTLKAVHGDRRDV